MFDFSYVLKGFGMMLKPGLKRYVIIPMLISILVLSLFVSVGYVQFDNFMSTMMPQDGWLMYLSWLLWPVFALVFVFIIFYGFTFIANLIGAPFNSKLSEAVAIKLDPNVDLPESDPFLKDVSKSIGSELRKILYYLLRAMPLLVLVWIPLTSPFASIAWLLFSAWFLTIEYTGYPLENQKLLFKEQRKLLRKKPISALSFGAGVSVLMFIPIINLAVMPAAVAGATIYWHEKLKA